MPITIAAAENCNNKDVKHFSLFFKYSGFACSLRFYFLLGSVIITDHFLTGFFLFFSELDPAPPAQTLPFMYGKYLS